jgi:hypothetical protein
MSATLKKIDGKYILLSETNQIVYFIEDLDTHEWYYNTLRLRFAHTTAEEQYSYPKEQYWTKDPLCAMSCDNKEIMQQILDGMITRKDSNIMTDKYGEFKRLEITEHEFVVNPKIIESDLDVEDIERQLKGYDVEEMATKRANFIQSLAEVANPNIFLSDYNSFIAGASAIEELNKEKVESFLETIKSIRQNAIENQEMENREEFNRGCEESFDYVIEMLYKHQLLQSTEFPCTYKEINGKIKVTILK